jgi:hypothetical protein
MLMKVDFRDSEMRDGTMMIRLDILLIFRQKVGLVLPKGDRAQKKQQRDGTPPHRCLP